MKIEPLESESEEFCLDRMTLHMPPGILLCSKPEGECEAMRTVVAFQNIVLPDLAWLLKLRLKCPKCRCGRRLGAAYCDGEWCGCTSINLEEDERAF